MAEFEASVRPFELKYRQEQYFPHVRWTGIASRTVGHLKDTLIEGLTGTPGKVDQVSPSTLVEVILVILVVTIVVTRQTNPKLKLTIPPIVAVNPMILVITISNRRKPTCYACGKVASYLGPYTRAPPFLPRRNKGLVSTVLRMCQTFTEFCEIVNYSVKLRILLHPLRH